MEIIEIIVIVKSTDFLVGDQRTRTNDFVLKSAESSDLISPDD
jgi:hypothetical protein